MRNPVPRLSRELMPRFRALSEVLGSPLPYDDVLSLRDRMWEISPTLVRYDTTEPTSIEVVLAGLKAMAAGTAGAKVTGSPFKKPIENFYQTDPISRAYVTSPPPYGDIPSNAAYLRSVTMAQCTRSFTKGENYGFSELSSASQASYA